MYISELKRILRSKVFIISMLLLAAYFVYVTGTYIIRAGSDIEHKHEEAKTFNSVCDELMANYPGDVPLNKWLQQVLAEKEAVMNEANEKFSAQFDENDDEPHLLDEETKKARDDYFSTLSVCNTLNYTLYDYQAAMRKNVEKAVKMVNDPTQSAYTVRLNTKAAEKYNSIKNFSLIDSSPASAWYGRFTMERYTYFYIMLFMVFIIIAADTFCSENTYSMESMVFTSKYGRKRLFVSKVSALVSICVFTMLILTFIDVMIAWYIMGDTLMFEPLQTLPRFQNSTANISFFGLLLICDLLRTLALVFVVSIAAAVSQLSRKVFISLIIDCLVMFSMFAVYMYSSGYMVNEPDKFESTFDADRFALFERLRAFLPTSFIRPYVYFEKLDYINVANYPFLRLTTCVIVTAAVTVLLLLFAYFRFGNVLKFLPRAKAHKPKKNMTLKMQAA